MGADQIRCDVPHTSLENAIAPSQRIVITSLSPSVDGGRYAVKCTEGDELVIEADIFADGHEQLGAIVVWTPPGAKKPVTVMMEPVGNDRWRGRVTADSCGTAAFHIEAWLDVFGGFVRDTIKKREAGQNLILECEEGRALIEAACKSASGTAKSALKATLAGLAQLSPPARLELLLSEETRTAMRAAGRHPFHTKTYSQTVLIERKRTSFASWYELFPRSQSDDPSRHGTLRDVIAQLPRIHAMGFDVVYLTPIHPIGETNRKGRNNALRAETGEPGSPYAIGAKEGGHDAIHPELGNEDDFHALVQAVNDHGMELALDFAIQMSPDHPWLKKYPHWFARRPDGSMKYAENPPKKYEDIVNVDFYADKAVWTSLGEIVRHWIALGVRIFRVDNPHTKPFPFWQWLIADIHADHPDVIFLSEAFTRPKVMYHLAKIGFSQSYTYFTWRNTKQDLTDYLTELATAPVRHFFRPHFFTNTPDINPYFLQTSGRAGFLIRAALASTMSGLWGIYSGFELCEAEPLPGREEYLNAEKYEIRTRDYNQAGNIVAEITALNRLRHREPALQTHTNITFYNAFNDNIIYFGKTAPGREDRILIAVNLDPHNTQRCDFEIPLWEWALPDHESLEVEDLLHGGHFTWSGKIQHMTLTPQEPYAVWRIRPRAGSRP